MMMRNFCLWKYAKNWNIGLAGTLDFAGEKTTKKERVQERLKTGLFLKGIEFISEWRKRNRGQKWVIFKNLVVNLKGTVV